MENKHIQKIAIVAPRGQIMQQSMDFWKKCREIGPSLNCTLSEPFICEIPDANVATYTSAIERQIAQKGPNLVSIYNTISTFMSVRPWSVIRSYKCSLTS